MAKRGKQARMSAEELEAVLRIQRDFIRAAIGEESGQAFAERAGVSHSTINRRLSPDNKGLYGLASLRKIAAAAKIQVPQALLSPGSTASVNPGVRNGPQDRDDGLGGVTVVAEEEKKLLDLFRKLDTLGKQRVLLIAQESRLEQLDRPDDPLETRRRA